MPDWDQVYNSLILVEEIIFLRDHAIVMDLIIMDMQNFDMILGIDFLSRYRAKMDYRKKKVKFSRGEDEQLIFRAS